MDKVCISSLTLEKLETDSSGKNSIFQISNIKIVSIQDLNIIDSKFKS